MDRRVVTPLCALVTRRPETSRCKTYLALRANRPEAVRGDADARGNHNRVAHPVARPASQSRLPLRKQPRTGSTSHQPGSRLPWGRGSAVQLPVHAVSHGSPVLGDPTYHPGRGTVADARCNARSGSLTSVAFSAECISHGVRRAETAGLFHRARCNGVGERQRVARRCRRVAGAATEVRIGARGDGGADRLGQAKRLRTAWCSTASGSS